MFRRFAAAAATVQCSSGGGCTTHHQRLPRCAAVAGAAVQRREGEGQLLNSIVVEALAGERELNLKSNAIWNFGSP